MNHLNIENYYTGLCNSPSDINEHLPLLRSLSLECESITEMGVRWVVSTFAFVTALPKKLTCIDLFHPEHFGNEAKNRINLIEEYCKINNINFSLTIDDTLSIDIEETDLLFIDTLHSYYQCKEELKKHGNKAKKYIVLHDTTLFGSNDDGGMMSSHPERYHPTKHGLNIAITEFLEENKNWTIKEVKTNNNGLTILQRLM
jgi:hypothetical protein